MLQDLQKAGKMSVKVERESSVALYAARGSRCRGAHRARITVLSPPQQGSWVILRVVRML